MLKQIILVATWTLLTTSVSKASGTFCSGFSVHYVAQYEDFGAQPPEGTKLGETFLSIGGNLIEKVENFMEAPSVGSFDLFLKFENENILKSEDLGYAGFKIYSAQLTVQKEGATIANEIVLCQKSWAMVP